VLQSLRGGESREAGCAASCTAGCVPSCAAITGKKKDQLLLGGRHPNFRQLVLGCIDSYDSNQILIFQIFRDLQDSQNGFLEFCKFSQNFANFS
jgi:hypothetical protein